MCELYFPTKDGVTPGLDAGKTTHQLNRRTAGWKLKDPKRLVFVNGEWDPWRGATVGSDIRPGGPLASTTAVPTFLVPQGMHCSDLLTRNGAVNAGVKKVQDDVAKIMKGWVDEFYTERGIYRGGKTF